jgi:hypothetical protein
MDQHCGFCDTKIVGNLLAPTTLYDIQHYLAFPWGERLEARPKRLQAHFTLKPDTIESKSEVDCMNQIVIVERLRKEFNSTALHRLYRHWYVAMSGYKDDRDFDICSCKLTLKVKPALPRQSHIEHEAGWAIRAVGFEESGSRCE